MAGAIDAKSTLTVDGTDYEIHRLDGFHEGHVARLPFSLKILLENLLRHADRGDAVLTTSGLAIGTKAEPDHEIAFTRPGNLRDSRAPGRGGSAAMCARPSSN
jgi:aconitate hydratase